MQNLEKVAFGRAKVSNLCGGAVRRKEHVPVIFDLGEFLGPGPRATEFCESASRIQPHRYSQAA
jgi:hypothetical protein